MLKRTISQIYGSLCNIRPITENTTATLLTQERRRRHSVASCMVPGKCVFAVEFSVEERRRAARTGILGFVKSLQSKGLKLNASLSLLTF